MCNSNANNVTTNEIAMMKTCVGEIKLDLILKCVERACEQSCFSRARKFLNVDANNVSIYIVFDNFGAYGLFFLILKL